MDPVDISNDFGSSSTSWSSFDTPDWTPIEQPSTDWSSESFTPFEPESSWESSWSGDLSSPLSTADDLFMTPWTPAEMDAGSWAAAPAAVATAADKPLFSVSGAFEQAVVKRSLEATVLDMPVKHLERQAADAFAHGGERGAAEAFEKFQNLRAEATRVGGTLSTAGHVAGLFKEEQVIRELAREGKFEEAMEHTFGTATSTLVDGTIDLFGKPAAALGAGDVVKQVVKRTGISSAAYGLGSLIGEAAWNSEWVVGSAVWLSDVSGKPLRPGVREHYEQLQSR